MILLYHHILPVVKDNITVTPDIFARHMEYLKNKKVVYLDAYNPSDPNNCVITFDDGYADLLTCALPVLRQHGYRFEVFVNGNFYKRAQKLFKPDKNYLNKKQLLKIVEGGGRLQYHSASHPYLDSIADVNVLEAEIKTPEELKALDKNGFKWFAYPFCVYNEQVIKIVKKYYSGACSGNGQGNAQRFSLERTTINNGPLGNMQNFGHTAADGN